MPFQKKRKNVFCFVFNSNANGKWSETCAAQAKQKKTEFFNEKKKYSLNSIEYEKEKPQKSVVAKVLNF